MEDHASSHYRAVDQQNGINPIVASILAKAVRSREPGAAPLVRCSGVKAYIRLLDNSDAAYIPVVKTSYTFWP